MTQFIKHRVNKIIELKDVESEWGVEIDVRSDVSAKNSLHLSHEAWERGDDFRAWLTAFKNRKIKGPLIVNTKEDGLEGAIIDILAAEKIENYFFLDTVVPTLVRWAVKTKNKNFAARLSTYENAANAIRFEGLVDWVWADCFGGEPLSEDIVKALKGRFKICLVSPELQGQSHDTIPRFYDLVRHVDAICTKRPDLWKVKND